MTVEVGMELETGAGTLFDSSSFSGLTSGSLSTLVTDFSFTDFEDFMTNTGVDLLPEFSSEEV